MANVTLVSGILEAKSRIFDITARAGRAALNARFPDDFEYYLCALELVDATNENNVLEYLVFPIQPSNITIVDTKLQNTAKTAAGTVVLENNSFVPIDISLSGNFGRKLKTLAAQSDIAPYAITNENVSKTLDNVGAGKIKLPEFSTTIKTGYGVTKVLERIYQKSSTIVNGKPVMLFFYCFAFNTHYLVQPTNLQISQSEGNNMIWDYSLQLKGIAPASEIKSSSAYKKTLSKYVQQDQINKGIQSTLDFVKNQKTILSNQLRQKVGDSLDIDETLNRTPQLTKVLTLP